MSAEVRENVDVSLQDRIRRKRTFNCDSVNITTADRTLDSNVKLLKNAHQGLKSNNDVEMTSLAQREKANTESIDSITTGELNNDSLTVMTIETKVTNDIKVLEGNASAPKLDFEVESNSSSQHFVFKQNELLPEVNYSSENVSSETGTVLPPERKKRKSVVNRLKGKDETNAVVSKYVLNQEQESQREVETKLCKIKDQSENEFDEDSDNEIERDTSSYVEHFEYELPEQPSAETASISYEKHNLVWPEMGDLTYYQVRNKDITIRHPALTKNTLKDFKLKDNLFQTCEAQGLFDSPDKLSKLQLEFFNVISDYYDLLFMNRTYENGEHLRLIYTAHVLNHILKTRAKIIHHNSKLKKNPDEEYRDQGFTRPTSIILVPFRDDCFQIVAHLISLLSGCTVMNKKRFVDEYGSYQKPNRIKKKPQDFEETFAGNIDEDFKLGIRIKNKSFHLYTEFYASDLIIASPLGLRQIVGAEGDKGRDYDFLSSIDILIIDRADVLLLQNFHHLVHVLQLFNMLPKESHDCNFFRVRMYALNGMAKQYRQTILLSSVEHHWFETIIFRNYCQNYAGYLCTWRNVESPAVRHVLVGMKMCFRWFQAENPGNEMDCRFNFFITHVLPDYKDQIMAQTLIYIPSYFDFVRLRNYFRETELSCVMVCEYSKRGKVAQARNVFFKGQRHFMLYTERIHFYSRCHIKGIQHIIFYQLPTYPRFFSEMCNALVDCHPSKKFQEKSCSILASKYDFLQMKHVVGLKQAKRMINSKKNVFVNYVGVSSN